jgi:hypothetical protein
MAILPILTKQQHVENLRFTAIVGQVAVSKKMTIIGWPFFYTGLPG